nr:retrovirus-related Pol polyprotein from transposon TNT 1-94 [Tanacetum cinerariifolium]
MKAVRSSSHVLIVPSLSLSSHVFASPVTVQQVQNWKHVYASKEEIVWGVVFMLGEWFRRIVGDCCMNDLIDEYGGMMKYSHRLVVILEDRVPNRVSSSFKVSKFGFGYVPSVPEVEKGTKLGDHINDFHKLILDLANIYIEIKDEDQALILLTSLPSSYENFVETLLYGRESFIMEDVLATMNSRELKKRTEGTKKETCDGLYVRGRSNHSEGHLKRDCRMKKSSGFFKKGKHDLDSDSSNDEGNAYFGEALVVVGNDEMTELIMDSGGSYHMTHKRDFLYDFKRAQGDRKDEVFQVSNDDDAVDQRRLKDKQLKEKKNTDFSVEEQKKVHLGIKLGENIRVTGVPGQEGA